MTNMDAIDRLRLLKEKNECRKQLVMPDDIDEAIEMGIQALIERNEIVYCRDCGWDGKLGTFSESVIGLCRKDKSVTYPEWFCRGDRKIER